MMAANSLSQTPSLVAISAIAVLAGCSSQRKTEIKKMGGALALALCLFAAMLGMAPPGHADVNGYLACIANALGSARVDDSWVSTGRMVERDLNSGVSPANEVVALERHGLAGVAATAIVQCVVANNP
jgi:hypothetical protein